MKTKSNLPLMSGSVLINIPLKPYLTKYLQKKYGDTHYASRTSWLGKYLVDIVDKQYRKENITFKHDTFYPISIPPSIVKTNGFGISAVKINALGLMIEKVFRNDLYSYIDVSVASNLQFQNIEHNSVNKQNTMKAIEQFLNFYSISEDDLSIESIYRDYYRNKKTA